MPVLILNIILLLLILMVIVVVWNRALSHFWVRREEHGGKFVDTDAGRRFVTIRGHGSPAIIFETGMGDTSSEYWPLMDLFSKKTAAVIVDRGGYGKSGRAEFPRKAGKLALELHLTLKAAGVKPPYILAGHSYGGMVMTRFAQMYPDDVKGVVLIDPAPLNISRFKEIVDAKTYKKIIDKMLVMQMMKTLGGLGLIRLFRMNPFRLKGEAKDYFIEHASIAHSAETAINEYVNIEDSIAEIKHNPFPKVPLIVLCRSIELYVEIMTRKGIAEKDARNVELLWQEILKDYLKLSPLSEWQVVENTTHMVHLDQPHAVISAIDKILSS